MGKKLFRVTLEYEVVVYAKDEQEAEWVAERDTYDIESNETPTVWASEVTTFGEVEVINFEESIPYGRGVNDRTCADIWREIHEPPPPTDRDIEAAGQAVLFPEVG